MATEVWEGKIKVRRGPLAKLNMNNLEEGEFAVATDVRQAFLCFSTGYTKRLATHEDMELHLKTFTEDTINNLTKGVEEITGKAVTATNNADDATTKARAATTAAENATKAAQDATTASTTQTQKAATATTAAENAAKSANDATTAANQATTATKQATEESKTATTAAKSAADEARKAADEACKAADEAESATDEARMKIVQLTDLLKVGIQNPFQRASTAVSVSGGKPAARLAYAGAEYFGKSPAERLLIQ